MPPLSDQVDNSKCDTHCVGFPADNCMFCDLSGVPVYYAVWNSGLKSVITNAGASASTSSGSSSTSASAAAVVTVSGGALESSTVYFSLSDSLQVKQLL
jgi:hypothetical protein